MCWVYVTMPFVALPAILQFILLMHLNSMLLYEETGNYLWILRIFLFSHVLI